MRVWYLFLLAALIITMSLAVIIACGDDDDDDDNDDAGPTDCEAYFMECKGEDAETAAASCEEDFYSYDDECYLEAADALFDCVGTDCEKYDDCSDTYLEDIEACE